MPKIISMKQLREHFTPIKKGLRRGDSYLLMYRSKPLATLVPYQEKLEKPQVSDNQNLLRHKQSSPNLQTKFTPNSVASTHNLIAETESNLTKRYQQIKTRSNFAEALEQLQAAAKQTPATQASGQIRPGKVVDRNQIWPDNIADRSPTWSSLDKTITHTQINNQTQHGRTSASATGVTAGVTTSKPKTDLSKIRKVLAP